MATVVCVTLWGIPQRFPHLLTCRCPLNNGSVDSVAHVRAAPPVSVLSEQLSEHFQKLFITVQMLFNAYLAARFSCEHRNDAFDRGYQKATNSGNRFYFCILSVTHISVMHGFRAFTGFESCYARPNPPRSKW